MYARISKKYIPSKKEKYMCEKHKVYFRQKLTEWKNEIIKSNSQALYSSNLVDNVSSPDIVDQASSYTEKSVEMRTVNRQIKLISKIDSALKRLKDGTYGVLIKNSYENMSPNQPNFINNGYNLNNILVDCWYGLFDYISEHISIKNSEFSSIYRDIHIEQRFDSTDKFSYSSDMVRAVQSFPWAHIDQKYALGVDVGYIVQQQCLARLWLEVASL